MKRTNLKSSPGKAKPYFSNTIHYESKLTRPNHSNQPDSIVSVQNAKLKTKERSTVKDTLGTPAKQADKDERPDEDVRQIVDKNPTSELQTRDRPVDATDIHTRTLPTDIHTRTLPMTSNSLESEFNSVTFHDDRFIHTPTAGNSQSLYDADSNRMLLSCRIGYLGSAAPTLTLEPPEVVTQPLSDMLHNVRFHLPDISPSGLHQKARLVHFSMYETGIDISTARRQAIYPVSTVYCAGALKVSLGDDGEFVYEQLSMKTTTDRQSILLFCMVLRETQGVKCLRCHVFTLSDVRLAHLLVQATAFAYRNRNDYVSDRRPLPRFNYQAGLEQVACLNELKPIFPETKAGTHHKEYVSSPGASDITVELNSVGMPSKPRSATLTNTPTREKYKPNSLHRGMSNVDPMHHSYQRIQTSPELDLGHPIIQSYCKFTDPYYTQHSNLHDKSYEYPRQYFTLDGPSRRVNRPKQELHPLQMNPQSTTLRRLRPDYKNKTLL